MARDWTDEPKTIAALEERLDRLAPGNTARVPIAAARELDDTGEPAWTVDVHVRIPGVCEYDVTGVGHTLAGALRRAYLGLNNETNLRRLTSHAKHFMAALICIPLDQLM